MATRPAAGSGLPRLDVDGATDGPASLAIEDLGDGFVDRAGGGEIGTHVVPCVHADLVDDLRAQRIGHGHIDETLLLVQAKADHAVLLTQLLGYQLGNLGIETVRLDGHRRHPTLGAQRREPVSPR